MGEYRGYKIKFEDGTGTRGYPTKRFCDWFLRHINKTNKTKGKVVECELDYYGDCVGRESSYQLAKTEEICIMCRNKTPVIDYEAKWFVFKNLNHLWVVWDKDIEVVREKMWKCDDLCENGHKKKIASNAYSRSYSIHHAVELQPPLKEQADKEEI
jgi:hypothetical protein